MYSDSDVYMLFTSVSVRNVYKVLNVNYYNDLHVQPIDNINDSLQLVTPYYEVLFRTFAQNHLTYIYSKMVKR